MLKDQSVDPNITKVSINQHGNWNRLENVIKGPNHWSQYMTQLSTNHHRGVGQRRNFKDTMPEKNLVTLFSFDVSQYSTSVGSQRLYSQRRFSTSVLSVGSQHQLRHVFVLSEFNCQFSTSALKIIGGQLVLNVSSQCRFSLSVLNISWDLSTNQHRDRTDWTISQDQFDGPKYDKTVNNHPGEQENVSLVLANFSYTDRLDYFLYFF